MIAALDVCGPTTHLDHDIRRSDASPGRHRGHPPRRLRRGASRRTPPPGRDRVRPRDPRHRSGSPPWRRAELGRAHTPPRRPGRRHLFAATRRRRGGDDPLHPRVHSGGHPAVAGPAPSRALHPAVERPRDADPLRRRRGAPSPSRLGDRPRAARPARSRAWRRARPQWRRGPRSCAHRRLHGAPRTRHPGRPRRRRLDGLDRRRRGRSAAESRRDAARHATGRRQPTGLHDPTRLADQGRTDRQGARAPVRGMGHRRHVGTDVMREHRPDDGRDRRAPRGSRGTSDPYVGCDSRRTPAGRTRGAPARRRRRARQSAGRRVRRRPVRSGWSSRATSPRRTVRPRRATTACGCRAGASPDSGWSRRRSGVGGSRIRSGSDDAASNTAYPGLGTTLLRSLLIGASRSRDEHLEAGIIDLYLELDLRDVPLLDFGQVEAAAAAGLEQARAPIAAWLDERDGSPWGVPEASETPASGDTGRSRRDDREAG